MPQATLLSPPFPFSAQRLPLCFFFAGEFSFELRQEVGFFLGQIFLNLPPPLSLFELKNFPSVVVPPFFSGWKVLPSFFC